MSSSESIGQKIVVKRPPQAGNNRAAFELFKNSEVEEMKCSQEKDGDNVMPQRSSKEIKAESIMRRQISNQRVINGVFIGFAVLLLALDLVRLIISKVDQ